ncbi:MAG TPA: hypothetical protein VLX44_14745 [Xanthobacteraceae bacterium]|nr:hypothetical protein [Xanthobacteraceae bacterium]
MALQDFIGQAYPFSDRAGDHGRRDETSHWQVRGAARNASRRPPAPSRRAARAHMPRRIFLALVLGWGIALAGLLAIVLALRGLG